MSKRDDVPFELTREVRDTCLCLHLQRAARVVGRHFDETLRPFGLTNGQFSLMMALNRAEPPSVGEVSALLAMDRTTVTANLKPLERRGLIKVRIDAADKRGRRLSLTSPGRRVLAAAVPAWKRAQAATERLLPQIDPDKLRAGLYSLSRDIMSNCKASGA